jgi:mannan endo-1,4-beta-mannosidase
LSGATTKVATDIKGYSGKGYVTGFNAQDCEVTIPFSVKASGLYKVTIGYHSGSGDKGFNFKMNSGPASAGTFKLTGSGWGKVSAGKFMLAAGNNKAVILDGWGYYEVDYIDIESASVNPPKPPPNTLADPKATPATHKLMTLLVNTFGKKVIAGTQVRKPTLDAVAYALKASGKQPALIEGGLLDYSPSFVERAGNVTNGYIESLGKWATTGGGMAAATTAGNGRGLVALCWHWNSPCGVMDTKANPDSAHPWYQAFYTKNTHYNLSRALANPTSEEYVKMIRDLDTIAVQLAKTSAVDLPVLWRPLHEASGGWFWWGAHGPEAFKKLWALMFTRFTQVHKLHNLIWVYTADPSHHDWYPGDDMVDVVGADIYEATGSSMDGTWEDFKAQYEGKKLITLSETGGIVVPDSIRAYKTMWSWFNTWSITKYNITEADVKAVYNDANILTLDELPDWRA